MAPVLFDRELHAAGEQTSVTPYALTQACAWWVGSELVRRHTSELFLVETHPLDGLYDCLTVMRRPKTPEGSAALLAYLNMNRGGHITLEYAENHPGVDDERFNWLEVLLAPNRRKYVVEQIEAELGLLSPGSSPPTTSQSVGVRLISRFLSRIALGPRRWVAYCGYWPLGGRSFVESLFEPFYNLEAPIAVEDASTDPVAAFWFLCPEDKKYVLPASEKPRGDTPVVAVDCWKGIAWIAPGRRSDLMADYQILGRSMDRLLNHVLPVGD